MWAVGPLWNGLPATDVRRAVTALAPWNPPVGAVLIPQTAGLQGQPTVFLFTDAQCKEEAFLEDVTSILNTGVPPRS